MPDYDDAKQLLDELAPPEPPSAPAAPETAPMKTYAIFHDNLDEDKIASALRSIPRGSVGEIKFAYTVNKVFKAIGWLADRMNTHFVAWMKQQRIIAVKTGDFKSVKGEDPQMKALETVVRGTFTTLLPNGSLKDHDRFYKKNRWLINKGD